MKIRVEACWRGGPKACYYRVLFRGERFSVGHSEFGGGWTRAMATEALDYLERFYRVNRRNVRFHE